MTQNYLGIDWGVKKVGLSLASSETRIAMALKTIENTPELLSVLEVLIKKEGISRVIIGLPRYVKETRLHPAEMLGQKLVSLGVLVAYHDEMFTSKMAQVNLIESGKKDVGKKDDAEAARLLLQEWLDHEKSLGEASL